MSVALQHMSLEDSKRCVNEIETQVTAPLLSDHFHLYLGWINGFRSKYIRQPTQMSWLLYEYIYIYTNMHTYRGSTHNHTYMYTIAHT